MGTTKQIGFTASGKKIMEVEITQEDCDEINELRERFKLEGEESKPTKFRYIFG